MQSIISHVVLVLGIDPFRAYQLNHPMTLWMGSFVTVSCYDYYFVTMDPSDLNVIQ